MWRAIGLKGDRSATRSLALVCTVLAAMGLSSCETMGLLAGPDAAATANGQASPEAKYVPSDDPMREGYQQFQQGDFGLAQQYFQDAVEKAPRDAHAWLGLAASYDKLARFDMADRAYQSAVKLKGRTAQVLNNEGYSHLLRGDIKKARALFKEALRAEPRNETVIDNLALLDSGARYLPSQSD